MKRIYENENSGTQSSAQNPPSNVNTRPATFGETLVGINFNPAGDDKVGKAKRLCADLADLLTEEQALIVEPSRLRVDLYTHAIGEILNAQMNVVKVLTLKY